MPLAHLPTNDAPDHGRGCAVEQLPRMDSLAVFGMRVSRHFAQCRRASGRLALLWVEVTPVEDGETVNTDGLVHMAGQRLRNRVRGTDDVVQVGAQGFAVLLMAAGSSEAEIVERRLLHTLEGAYGVDGQLLHARVRMGAAVFPDHGRSGAELAEAARRRLHAD
ncbi:diguanylate cyclase domain-containing protein [Roseateles cellulosilyticus]|uniref:Diguanylate cyclase n=1 Tax=Pelomonas cellulosilytica TaxID=2906762 RepID=A0ABS8XKA5_9BURK|nr:diguanylate cyclase [Pelomonas sp. P8]MCE4553269.1 diguanylate cyclase [Pelomonas sp. P8]